MPKIKTHSGMKKRIKLTGSGKLLRRHGGRNHFLEKKRQSRKRIYTTTSEIVGKTKQNVRRMLGR